MGKKNKNQTAKNTDKKNKKQEVKKEAQCNNNIATFLTLDQTDASINSAKALKSENRFGNNNRDPIINFSNDDAPFKKLENPEDLSTIVCVGHSVEKNGVVIQAGNFKPHDFANKFNSQFLSKFDERNKGVVQDLYLVCCEAGLVNSDYSLAKQISDELVTRGFTSVKVHAIKPTDPSINAMHVTIVSQGGLTATTGALHVSVFRDKEYETFQEFEGKAAQGKIRANDPEKSDFMAKRLLYWNKTNVKAIYDEPANTIQPDVNGAARRVANRASAAVNRTKATANNNNKSEQSVTTPLTLDVTVGALMAYARQLREEAASPFSCFLFLMSKRKNDKAQELNAIAESLKGLNGSNVNPAAIRKQVTTAIVGKTNKLYKQGFFGISIFGKCRTRQLIESIEDGSLNKYIADSGLKITDEDKSLERTENIEKSFKNKTTGFKKKQ